MRYSAQSFSTSGSGNVKLANSISYQELTGSLNHLAITSRPDIAFAVSKLCQFNSKPTLTHLKAARRVLRYAIHTRSYWLKYCSDGSFELELLGYADADYGSNLIDRKSTMGYVFLFCRGSRTRSRGRTSRPASLARPTLSITSVHLPCGVSLRGGRP